MFHAPARRWRLLLAVVAVGALAGAAAAIGATSHSAADSTLVVDNSFTIKTSDPGAFDATASIVDRAIFDTRSSPTRIPRPSIVARLVVEGDEPRGCTFQLKRLREW